MKTTVISLGMLAAVASAYNPGHHLRFPRGNGTENLTTLTIKTTQVHTITSCAPTVTNCPAHATGIATLPEDQKVTKVVTDTMVLATTVCPVTDIAKVSSSVIAKASTGFASNSTIVTDIKPTAPASQASAKPGLATKTTDVVSDKTFTMTIGTGSTASVVTSTLHTTVKTTITVPASDASALPVTTGEATTTTTATTKVTRTVTISRNKSTGTGSPPGNTGKGDCPASTVTVTVAKEIVTVPATTVYVTVGTSNTAAQEPVATTKPATNDKSNGEQNKGQIKPSTLPDCPDSTTTLQTVVTVVPYPSGNGTHSTSGRAKPTGFARLRR